MFAIDSAGGRKARPYATPTRPVSIAAALLLLVHLTGCGPGVEEGRRLPLLARDASADEEAGMDAGPPETFPVAPDATVPADDAGMELFYPPGYRCRQRYPEISIILSAQQVGEGVRFVSMGQSTLLAEQEVDGVTQPVLVFLDPGMYRSGEARLASPPSESLRVIGVVNRRDAPLGAGWLFDHHAIVLVSAPDGNRLYGASPDPGGTAELQLIDEPSLIPAGAELRGLTYLQDKSMENAEVLTAETALQQVCALGNGIFCFSHDGVAFDSNTLVESGVGPAFNSLTVLERAGGWHAVAVGDGGRIAEIPLDGSGAPAEIESGTTDRLTGVSFYDGQLVISGEKGFVAYYEDFPSPGESCRLFEQSIVSLKWWAPDLRGIDEEGGVFGVPFGGCEACFFSVSLGTALQGRISGLDGDSLVLNENGLYRVSGKYETVVLE